MRRRVFARTGGGPVQPAWREHAPPIIVLHLSPYLVNLADLCTTTGGHDNMTHYSGKNIHDSCVTVTSGMHTCQPPMAVSLDRCLQIPLIFLVSLDLTFFAKIPIV